MAMNKFEEIPCLNKQGKPVVEMRREWFETIPCAVAIQDCLPFVHVWEKVPVRADEGNTAWDCSYLNC
jgi:hypothetical protein